MHVNLPTVSVWSNRAFILCATERLTHFMGHMLTWLYSAGGGQASTRRQTNWVDLIGGPEWGRAQASSDTLLKWVVIRAPGFNWATPVTNRPKSIKATEGGTLHCSSQSTHRRLAVSSSHDWQAVLEVRHPQHPHTSEWFGHLLLAHLTLTP